MTLQCDFPYLQTLLKGKPEHEPDDEFRIRHPSMLPGHRAKIFLSFNALVGFDEIIASKEVLYEPKRTLGEAAQAELERRLQILSQRPGRFTVTVEFFVPCTVETDEAYGSAGRYRTVTGTLWKIDVHQQLLHVGPWLIDIDDIYDLEETEGRCLQMCPIQPGDVFCSVEQPGIRSAVTKVVSSDDSIRLTLENGQIIQVGNLFFGSLKELALWATAPGGGA